MIPRKPLGLALAVAFGLSVNSAVIAQVSFYGSPAPASYGEGVGGNESDNEGEGSIDLGIFSRKPFRLSLALREGYDSNVNTTSVNPQGSWYTNIAAGIAYGFGSSRLQLTSDVNAGVTFYYNAPGDDVQFNGTASLAATYLATPRLTLDLSTVTAFLSQPDYDIVGADNQSGSYLYSSTTLGANYQWTKIISTRSSYNFTAYYYLDPDYNDNLGNISQTFSQSVLWLWKPKTTLVAEYRFNAITYYSADLNQYGNYFLLGFDQIFNPRFTWSFRLGAQVNFNNNPTDGQSTYVGPFGESILRYQFAKRSSLAWNMRYGTEQSGLTDVSQRQTFRTGLVLNHYFTARLSGVFALNYQCNYYDQANVINSFYENIVDFSVGLNFALNRWASLQAGYQFTIDLAPEDTGRNYTRNIVFAGVGFAL